MSTRNFEDVTVMWKPTESKGRALREFWCYISKKYNVKLENYWDLHQWSVEHFEDFWAEIWKKLGIIYSKPYDKVIDFTEFADGPDWFPGARLNYAENLLRYRDDHVALIATGEDRETKIITFAEVYKEACRYGAALKKLGLKKNDRVVCYMSNREEAIFAMLGTTAAGAVWSGAIPLLGSKAVLNRFKQVTPKFMFTIDRFPHNTEEIEMLTKIKEIADDLPSLEKVIIVSPKKKSLLKDISGIRNSCFLEEFLSLGENPDGSVPKLVFEQVSFSHPIFINYTSGTTGNPKPLVHGNGCLLTIATDFLLQFCLSRENRWLSKSPVGWASWNMFSTLLFLGTGMIVYEGIPFFLSPTHLWDLVDEHRISHLFLGTSVLDELEKKNHVPGKKNHLSSLKIIIAGGSVVKHQNFDFVYNKVKKDVLFASTFGCTEAMGFCMPLNETLPVHRGEIPTFSLGLNICCYNDEGKPVIGEVGEVVFVAPYPSLPLFLWGDQGREKYKKSYFRKFKDAFSIDDLIIINPVTKGVIAMGRSDETLKQRGCRFGSSEIYNIVDTFAEVRDSLCVSLYNKVGDESAVLFLKMKDGHFFTHDLERRIREAIGRELTVRHVPDIIQEIGDIPKNTNGKKVEFVAKNIINGMPYTDETVVNPESLEYYKEFAAQQQLCA